MKLNKTKQEVIVITSERTMLESGEITKAELYKVDDHHVSFIEYDNNEVVSYHLGGLGGDAYTSYPAEKFDWENATAVAKKELSKSGSIA